MDDCSEIVLAEKDSVQKKKTLMGRFILQPNSLMSWRKLRRL